MACWLMERCDQNLLAYQNPLNAELWQKAIKFGGFD
jgi:hypothetical protein